MAIFDSGRSRSTADGLAIGGVMPKENSKEMTAICNVMISLMGARGDGNLRTTLDLQETAEFYKAHRESVRWAIAAFQSKRGGSYLAKTDGHGEQGVADEAEGRVLSQDGKGLDARLLLRGCLGVAIGVHKARWSAGVLLKNEDSLVEWCESQDIAARLL